MLLKIDNLNFGWQSSLLLEGITAQLMPGDTVQLMGPNGAGKTTLLHLIAGLIPHFHRGAILTGDIFIQGRSIMAHPPRTFFPLIAYIPSLNLDFFLLTESLHQELQLTAAILKIDPQMVEQRIHEFTEFFPAVRSISHVPFKSMPQDQKILALSLIFYLQRAQLYLFDEIFPLFSEHVICQWLEFFRWLSRSGCAMIFVDHQRATDHFSKWILNDKHLVQG